MNCAQCEERLKADDKVVVFDDTLVHDGECLTKYCRKTFATEQTTYLGYLEGMVIND